MSVPFPEHTDVFLLAGPAGAIEVAVQPARNPRAMAVVCHPHPLYGGTMDNKVVTTIARALAGQGVHAIRFNFRGVNRSEGEHDQGKGEQQDLATVVDWLRSHHPELPLWLSGFSFGSFVAAAQAGKLQAERLLLVAPPVHYLEFDQIESLPEITWVVQGEADEVVRPAAVYEWAEQRQLHLEKLANTSHFFHGRLLELKAIVEAFSRV